MGLPPNFMTRPGSKYNVLGSTTLPVVGTCNHLISEALLNDDKNKVYADSRLEKEVRGRLKSEVIRLLSKETVVICDGLNYIKGAGTSHRAVLQWIAAVTARENLESSPIGTD